MARADGSPRWPWRGPGPWLGAAIVTALVVAALAGGAGDPSGAQFGGATSTIGAAPPTTLIPLTDPAGRVAYTTPSGDVVVANSDGSNPITVGSGAVSNGQGLAPLAWSPDGGLIAYVRNDGDLVLASADGTDPPIVAATDAVVLPSSNVDILSFDVTGVGVAYLEKGPGDIPIAAVAVYDGTSKGTTIPLTDPTSRNPTEFQFSPLDPYLYLQSTDALTGQNLSVAVVDPVNRQPFGSPFSVDDPTFAPDGAAIYGVAHTDGGDQLVQLDIDNIQENTLQDQDRICHPSVSPNGKKIVYGAGPDCAQLWMINSDGTSPRRVARTAGGRLDFSVGDFTWSTDGTVVSHPACQHVTAMSGPIHCGGPYIDVSIPTGKSAKGKVTRGQPAGNVVREFRPLVKALKVSVSLAGPLTYSGAMLVPSQPNGKLLQAPTSSVVSASLVDENDQSRIFDVKLLITNNSTYVVGTIHVTDPSKHFDEVLMVFGQVAIRSYRRALLRGIWMQTSSMPFTTGRIDLSIYR